MALITPAQGGFLASRSKSLFTASKGKDAKPSDSPTFYSRILFTHEAIKSEAWVALMTALIEAGRDKFGKNFDAMWREGGIRSPIRRDISTKGYDAERFAAFIQMKAYEDNPPAILNRDGTKMIDQTLLYPGAQVRSSVKVRAYEFKLEAGGYSRGISIDMLGVQKISDAPRISGGGDGAEGLDALPEEAGAADPGLAGLLGLG